jgi:hypothetical protein
MASDQRTVDVSAYILVYSRTGSIGLIQICHVMYRSDVGA